MSKGGSFKQDSSFNRHKSVNAKAMDALTGSSSFKQGGSFKQGDSFKDRSHKPKKPSPADCKPDPEGPLAHDPIECMLQSGIEPESPYPQRPHWQDDVMNAIADLDAAALARVLDERKDVRSWRDGRLKCSVVGGHSICTFGGRLYTTEPDGLCEALGGNYRFEREAERRHTAEWLKMLGVKTGDSLLHLVLRINGCELEEKAALAVELLGRGISFEHENSRRELAPQVDGPAFKHALFKLLPQWRAGKEEQAARAMAEYDAKVARARMLRATEKEREAKAEMKRRWASVRGRAAVEVESEKVRRAYHTKLEAALEKLERKECKRAKEGSPAYEELMGDLRALLPVRVRSWLAERR